MKTNVKHKSVKILLVITAGFGVFMQFGWSFFSKMVRCKRKKKNEKNVTTKKRKMTLSHLKVNHPRHRFEETYEEGKRWCREQNMQDCYIRSDDGLLLHAYYLKADEAKRTILLSHGYRGSGFGDFANIARFLHENECNLLFIDQRCCGESEGEYITFGALEQKDVQKWAYYLAHRNKDRLPIYLYGESMGASAAIMASGRELPKDVRGIIADCGFRSMQDQLRDMAANWFHLNWIELLLFRVDIFCRVFGHFKMSDADTTYALLNNKRPILFFHGSKDTFVDVRNTKYNYSICQAKKQVIIVGNARHLCSAYVNPELYRRKIMEFFAKYDNK